MDASAIRIETLHEGFYVLKVDVCMCVCGRTRAGASGGAGMDDTKCKRLIGVVS